MQLFEHEIEPELPTANILAGAPGWIPQRGPGEDGCFVHSRPLHVFCTLAKGHEGVHAAHGLGRIIATWPQVKP